MNRLMKKTLTLLLAAALTMGGVTTAFAADIDFGDGTLDPVVTATQGGTASYNPGTKTVTTDEHYNNVTGDGSGKSIVFTDSDANMEVIGDVSVGGIDARGDLIITGQGDTLTSQGNGQPGIAVNGNLTIDGIGVMATGDNGYAGVNCGGDLTLIDSELYAIGGGFSSIGTVGGPSTLPPGVDVQGAVTVGSTTYDVSDDFNDAHPENLRGGVILNALRGTTANNGANNGENNGANNTTNYGETATTIVWFYLYDLDGNEITRGSDGRYQYSAGMQFTVAVKPEGAAGGTFTGDNTMFSVDENGVITCLKKGAFTITYTPPAGSGYDRTFSIMMNIVR